MAIQLPEFDSPPVVEVALGVQFDPLPDLRTPQLGLFWQAVRKRFPRLEEHPPLESNVETFGTGPVREPNLRVEMMQKLPVPRVWFLNGAGTELIQVQPDRFVHNWRKLESEQQYPRYKTYIRPNFLKELNAFCEFVRRENLGEVKPSQCEVTYVNHIVAGRGWERPGQISKVLALCVDAPLDAPLDEPEEIRVSGSFVIPGTDGEPVGRLRFAIEPGVRKSDGQPLLVMNLVARGEPRPGSVAGAMDFLDIGREWVVNGFAALTTPEMHRVWGRKP